MKAEGYDFPPIEPDISPENDWYRFKLWLQGQPLREKLKDQLRYRFTPTPSERLTDEELLPELQRLIELLAEIRVSVEFVENVPLRLVYEHLLKVLDDEFDITREGCWHLDGCSGYCPECFQRPWCESGCSSCWPEDEEAGKISFVSTLEKYVSASPVSLQVLQELQAKRKEFDSYDDDDFPY